MMEALDGDELSLRENVQSVKKRRTLGNDQRLWNHLENRSPQNRL